MKLNNGRGWDYKPYSSQQQQQHHQQQQQHQPHPSNQGPNASGREIHGTPARTNPRPGITADRLNAAQPPPPSPAKAGAGKTRERPNASGGPPAKRQSGTAGGQETATPAASTQAQFQSSNANLPGRLASPNNGNGTATSNQPAQGVQGANEPQPTFLQKAMRALCCGTGRKS